MSKKIKLFITIVLTGIGVMFAAGESLLYVLSNRKGSVDYFFKHLMKESGNGVAFDSIKEKRKTDMQWLESESLKEYYITSADGLKLHAYLLPADVPSNRYVLSIHGYRAHGLIEFDSISRFYHEQGINVFMIDHRACGKSEGKYITYGAKETEDCIKWLSFMRSTFGEDIRIILHGCSMGSATVMMLCGRMLPNNVMFAVADCGYATLKSQLYSNFIRFNLPPSVCYNLFRIFARIHAEFDPDNVNPVISMEKCKIPVIFAHGKKDNMVPFDMVYAVYDACPNPAKKLITVENASHVEAFQVGDDLKNAIKEYIITKM